MYLWELSYLRKTGGAQGIPEYGKNILGEFFSFNPCIIHLCDITHKLSGMHHVLRTLTEISRGHYSSICVTYLHYTWDVTHSHSKGQRTNMRMWAVGHGTHKSCTRTSRLVRTHTSRVIRTYTWVVFHTHIQVVWVKWLYYCELIQKSLNMWRRFFRIRYTTCTCAMNCMCDILCTCDYSHLACHVAMPCCTVDEENWHTIQHNMFGMNWTCDIWLTFCISCCTANEGHFHRDSRGFEEGEVFMYICVYICACVYKNICIYVNIYVFIYT